MRHARAPKVIRHHRGTHQTLIQRSRRVPALEKAAFHQLTGAGRSHVLRPFFGLSESDVAIISERVAAFLDAAVKES